MTPGTRLTGLAARRILTVEVTVAASSSYVGFLEGYARANGEEDPRGRWQTFTTTRTNRRGSFSKRRGFSFTARGRTSKAFANSSRAGFPNTWFLPASSIWTAFR